MKSPKKGLTGVLLGVAVVFSATACGTDPGTAGPTGGTPPTTVESVEPPGESEVGENVAAPDHPEPAARAAQAALAAASGYVISLDPENGEVWSVLVRTDDGEGVELYVNASSGEVHREDAESLPGVAGNNPPAVSAVEAIDIVLAALSDSAQIRELDLGTERGVLVWEILAGDGGLIEFYVDASNGDILKREADD